MRKFDYSFLNNGMLPSSLINITGSIYSLRTAEDFRKSDYAKVFTELESIAKVQSVKSSNAIEGIVTSDQRIASIVNQSSAPLNHDEAEIAGYRDALNMIHTGYEHLSFNQKTILLLHETMMTPSSDDLAGKYKQNDNIIVEVDNYGNRKVRFRPVPANETKEAMEQLELAYLEACSDSNINQLLLIPCVILDFLCIHPFTDGNGRISRLITIVMLQQAGFDISRYISLEAKINEYKDGYYQALKESSSGWHENSSTYIPFITYFLQILYACYRRWMRNSLTAASAGFQNISKLKMFCGTALSLFLNLKFCNDFRTSVLQP